jgi:hypothetical protein
MDELRFLCGFRGAGRAIDRHRLVSDLWSKLPDFSQEEASVFLSMSMIVPVKALSPSLF